MKTFDKDATAYKIKDFEKVRMIGKGSYGFIYEAIVLKGTHKGEHVALKEVNMDNLEDKKVEYLFVSKKNF